MDNRKWTINDKDLPDNVTILNHAQTGAKIYLIGTNHFSKKSRRDVAVLIRNVQPHIVVLEVCKERVHLLDLNEEKIMQEYNNANFSGTLRLIKRNGLYNTLVYLYVITVYAQFIKQVGIIPGGEFRVAKQEALKIPYCSIWLGDRPISITMARALAKMSFAEKMRFMLDRSSVGSDMIEKVKKDEVNFKEEYEKISKFPAIKKVLLDERDIYLTFTLQMLARSKFTSPKQNLPEPVRIVGVVGMAHVPGIKQLWPVNQEPFVRELLTIPPRSRFSKLASFTITGSTIVLSAYVTYKIVDKIMSKFRKR